MKAKIVFYNQEDLEPKEKTKLKKKLYGHKDSSHKGKYRYKIEGILGGIKHLKPARAVIILRKEDLDAVTDILEKFKTKFRVYDIIIAAKEFKK